MDRGGGGAREATAAVALAAAVLSAGLAGAGAAQGRPCGPRDAVVAFLAERYGETRRAMGLTAKGTVMELWASETGSWTIAETAPDGMVCLAGSGEGFQAVPVAPPGEMN